MGVKDYTGTLPAVRHCDLKKCDQYYTKKMPYQKKCHTKKVPYQKKYHTEKCAIPKKCVIPKGNNWSFEGEHTCRSCSEV